MISRAQALASIPIELRTPLLDEFNSIVNNYSERRWTASELSGGKFCEIVYTILDGHAKGAYASKPAKPTNFVEACRKLENHSGIPRSFQILIPRLLPALYEIRNNRNVGHVGGDVDPNHMDATAVIGMTSWILAELVRVLHQTSVPEAQQLVGQLIETRIPLVWEIGPVKRVLRPDLSLRDQIILLVASSPAATKVEELWTWLEYKDRPYFNKVLRTLIAVVSSKLEVMARSKCSLLDLLKHPV